MSNPYVITDQVERGLSLLTAQFDNAEVARVVYTAFLEQVQELENLFYSLKVDRSYLTASGSNLDQWGEVVGEPRGGLDDGGYRRFISARIETNITDGTIPTLLSVLDKLTQGTNIQYQPNYPAGFIVGYEVETALSAEMQQRIKTQVCEELAPCGVGCVVVEAEAGYFGFADDPNAEGFDVGQWASII